MDVTVVAQGAWEYAPGVWLPALVLESDRDVWAELGHGEARLNAEGRVYYYALRALEKKGFWPASPGFSSLAEARQAVEQKVAVDWGRESSPQP
ncbi:hypothetical protein [Luteococcus peritonei]|uniref:Uncharacterized protein n=1 Tax=Luteococcus peritonei TaxID=88874 RepID=A0ABW4RT69_9ACTN